MKIKGPSEHALEVFLSLQSAERDFHHACNRYTGSSIGDYWAKRMPQIREGMLHAQEHLSNQCDAANAALSEDLLRTRLSQISSRICFYRRVIEAIKRDAQAQVKTNLEELEPLFAKWDAMDQGRMNPPE